VAAIRSIRLPDVEAPADEKSAFDLTVLIPVLMLVALGVSMVFSASIPMAAIRESEDIYYYLKREFLFAGVGLAAMYLAARVSMDAIRRNAGWLLTATLFFLVLVLIVGVRINGAKSWLRVPGTGLLFQPSELAKIALVVVTARYFAQFPRGIPSWQRALPPFAILGTVVVLIAVQPDMGTAAVVLAAMFVFFHIGGAKLRHLFAAGAAALPFAALMVWRNPYQLERLLNFILRIKTPAEGDYHTNQALIAMGSGGLTGSGYCGSIEKYFYLPAAITDSILGVIGEELGFITVFAVLALFAFLAWRGITIARNAPDRFSGLVAAGVTVVIVVQALLNIAVVTGSLPATGVPLPFVSYGGSSLLFSLVGVGLLLNVARRQAVDDGDRETP
jgi:cell division protein FtsW